MLFLGDHGDLDGSAAVTEIRQLLAPARGEVIYHVGAGGGEGAAGRGEAPYPEEHGGMVLSATINQYAYASLRPRRDSRLTLASLDYDVVARYDHPRRMRQPCAAVLHEGERRAYPPTLGVRQIDVRRGNRSAIGSHRSRTRWGLRLR